MLSFIWAIIIGFIVGLVAKLLIGGPSGFIVTVLVGIGGSILATALGQSMGWYGPGETSGFIGDVVGAVLILVLLRGLRRQSPPPAF